MRKRFEIQLGLNQTPIEQVNLPTKSRDELPPVLAGLQWIFVTPEANEEIFRILESKMGVRRLKKGRPGMDLWHILVLGVVRLALGCDYDRLEYLVHYDRLMREIMGLEGRLDSEFGYHFNQKSLSENVCHINDDMLSEINQVVAKYGRKLLKKKEEEKLEVKADSYVLESDVHFPTDFNLLWDACRKCIVLLSVLCNDCGLSGWRKSHDWSKKIKSLMRLCAQISGSGGVNKEERLKAQVIEYLQKVYQLEQKVNEAIERLLKCDLSISQCVRLQDVRYFHEMLIKHIDLIERRVLKDEKIPHCEKVFSLFEPHTEWVNKGKKNPSIELGHKVLISTDQYGFILDYKVMEKTCDVDESIARVDRLFSQYGEDSIASFSVDKGFSSKENRELLELFIPEVIMPKKGKCNQQEQKTESEKRFKLLRNKHSAIESNINSLEHHGLDRCPDKGLHGFKRYTGLGVLAYNLHKIGKQLLRCTQPLKKAA
jgi:transposase, IS5 family